MAVSQAELAHIRLHAFEALKGMVRGGSMTPLDWNERMRWAETLAMWALSEPAEEPEPGAAA